MAEAKTAGAQKPAIPKKKVLVQPIMLNMLYGLAPAALGSVYFFGLRSLVMLAVCAAFAFATEAAFTFREGKPVTSAVFVSASIYALSLPATTPFWIAVVGVVFGILFGKMVFGGFGYNVFNPAMVGRCFVYLAFPIALTNRWVEPFRHGLGGFTAWLAPPPVDALTSATPLELIKGGGSVHLIDLVAGTVSGSFGETSVWLVLLGGLYIVYKKSANWRFVVSCLAGGVVMSGTLGMAEIPHVPDPLTTLCAGSFLFGAFFVVTEPVSGPKQKAAMWIYGFLIGLLIVVIRRFSGWTEGVMWSVLIMNIFVSLLDMGVKTWKSRKKAAAS